MFELDTPQASPLGKHSEYITQYTPTLLFPIPRAPKREEIGLYSNEPLPFHGTDLWTGYELSWLNARGKPCIALLHIRIPAHSPRLIESKSLKLYLNSYNQTRLPDIHTLHAQIVFDLSAAVGLPIEVDIQTPQQFHQIHYQELTGQSLDELDIEIKNDQYIINPELLTVSTQNIVSEVLYSNLLKSNCLVTGQPDWASIQIEYHGAKIDHENLLRYLISFRQHNEFHEQCIERIFMDILHHCHPEQLTIYARYTRRGGLDINPWRSNIPQRTAPKNIRTARQ